MIGRMEVSTTDILLFYWNILLRNEKTIEAITKAMLKNNVNGIIIPMIMIMPI